MAPVKSIVAASMLLAAQLVSGHSVITNAVGNAGGSGMALGVDSSTPRDGTRRNPFQQDATRFRGASAKTVGETVGAGANNVESGTSKIMAETGDSLPQVTGGGELTMTLHQVNSDGAGPYTCMINADGTGQGWDNIQVTQNVEGSRRGRNRDGSATDFTLKAAIPANQQCSGSVAGENNVCLVRCQNPAAAGPFGGVVPVQMAGDAGATPVAGGAPAATPVNAGNGNAINNAGNNNAGNNNAGNNNAGNGNAVNGNTGNGNAVNGNTGNGNAVNGNNGNGNAVNGNTGNGNAGNGNAVNGNTGAGRNGNNNNNIGNAGNRQNNRRALEFRA